MKLLKSIKIKLSLILLAAMISLTSCRASSDHKVFILKYRIPSEIAQVIGEIVGPDVSVVADDEAKTLMVIDTVENISRVERIIKLSDFDSETDNSQIKIFILRYIDPNLAAEGINKILEAIGNKPSNVQVIPEHLYVNPEKQTKLLFTKAPPETMEQIDLCIMELDAPTTARLWDEAITAIKSDENMEHIHQLLNEWNPPIDLEQGITRFYSLRNISSAQMADLLNSIFSKKNNSSSMKLTFIDIPDIQMMIGVSNSHKGFEIANYLINEYESLNMTYKIRDEIGQITEKVLSEAIQPKN